MKKNELTYNKYLKNIYDHLNDNGTVFVLLDCRHKPNELDKMMLEFLQTYQIPFMLIVTKVDKIAKSKIPQACSQIAKELGVRKEIIMPFAKFFCPTKAFIREDLPTLLLPTKAKETLLNYIESIIC